MPIKNPILRHHSGVPLVPSLPPDRARESGIAVWTRARGQVGRWPGGIATRAARGSPMRDDRGQLAH